MKKVDWTLLMIGARVHCVTRRDAVGIDFTYIALGHEAREYILYM